MLKRFLGPLTLLVLLIAACTQAPPGLRATVLPADGDTDVSIGAVVTATFNLAIDQSTLDGAFTLSSEDGDVAGELSYDAGLRTATFTPAQPLEVDTTYTAALAGSLRSSAGGRLPIPVTGSYSWSFTTEADAGMAVTAVEVSPASSELAPGETQQFSAAVTAVGGADESVSWSSSNEDVATVDADGLVTAVAVGSATITATSVFDAAVSGSATVNVSAPAVVGVTVTPAAAAVFVGDEVQLTAEVEVVGGADDAVTWSSSDEDVATVDADGLVTGVSLGTATITATSVFDTAVSGSATVTVADAPLVVSVSIVDPGEVYETDVLTLTADVVVLGDLSDEVSWQSSDPAVATIDEASGALTALSAGTTTITATSVEDPGVSDTLELEVLAATVVSVTLTPDPLAIDAGQDGQLTADVVAQGGADPSLTWASDDEAIATVDADGLVTAVAPGTATITATSVFDPAVSGSATVNVAGVLSVTVEPTTADLLPTGSEQLTATVDALHGADDSVTWESSDPLVATVDADGLVTAVAAGTATVTATSVFDTTVSGSADVTVHDLLVVDDYLTEAGYEVDGAVAIDAPVVSGGLAPYGFALTAGALPAGLTLAADGSIGGTPTETGTFSGTVTVTDALEQTGTADFSVVVVEAFALNPYLGLTVDTGDTVDPQALVVTGAPLYSYEVVTIDPADPDLPAEWAQRYTDGIWSDHTVGDQGPLAAGLVADPADGTVAGTITAPAGFYRTYLQVTDDLGRVDVVQIEVSVGGP